MRRAIRTACDLTRNAADRSPDSVAVVHARETTSYGHLDELVGSFAAALARHGIGRFERIGIYLPKSLENVVAMFGAARAGAVFVPINPVLKPAQVQHIMRDCDVRCLITSAARLGAIAGILPECQALGDVVLVDAASDSGADGVRVHEWREFIDVDGAPNHSPANHSPAIATDPAAILYTSGSTGKAKGVVISHGNIVVGAQTVSGYLGNTAEDRILAVLPLSFDAGFSQLTTAFHVGAAAVLLDFLLPNDVVKVAARERITGITAVPPLWVQIADLDWPDEARERIRYFANTGGKMPRSLLARLRDLFPKAEPFLMYGLTEAFRSTFLDPGQVDARPDSIGKAIPGEEVLVVREDGSICATDEPGELVHRGPLVSLGYWNDPERTAARFRPAPSLPGAVAVPELAVWSGDSVRRDADGYLYFVGRRDDMIKTSGYRVSPSEVEEVAYSTGLVAEAAAIGAAHPQLGQTIVLLVVAKDDAADCEGGLMKEFQKRVPKYMVPTQISVRSALPKNPNGKIDRNALKAEVGDAAAPAGANDD